MIYLYAITDRPEAALPALAGLEDAPLISLAYRDVAAVASLGTAPGVSTALSSLEAANVWRHEVIVEALMSDRTVLPVRFGTALADEDALQSVLKTQYAGFIANMKRVYGRVELSVQVLWDGEEQGSKGAGERGSESEEYPTPSALQPSSLKGCGCAYMLARLTEEQRDLAWRQRAETLADEISRPLKRLAAENTHQVLVTPRLLLKAAYLVARERVAIFREEINNLSPAYPTLRFLCTGPWPPYNFVSSRETDPPGDNDD